jgi:hypothetical protein
LVVTVVTVVTALKSFNEIGTTYVSGGGDSGDSLKTGRLPYTSAKRSTKH